MTDDPIDLDGRRTVVGRHETEMRRRPANDTPSLVPSAQPHLGSLEDQMLAEPARISFDPTNRSFGSTDLIPVAEARRIEQVAPVSGSFHGRSADVLEMEVRVDVRGS
ncbi:hypothetical protein [Marivita geojedonensis]|uniref:Uncharacterized protein n=1 Tax=Marivita geojedonensis TaxID=1123756 RepID=A0A1X4N7Q3_9RHOB|nr:hypothetical protein [Marivita geojedonensis]OSQ42268.1 hypothetical protein MGEO_20690 [Marivita geojedonensis]PRY71052.1 hypothetical protein CLV76_1489 [Marivita geojedonensis]